MKSRDESRSEALDLIAKHLLAVGLPGSSLRSLAAAAGVSDRMLLYYFADKNEVLTLALGALAAKMATELDRAIPTGPKRGFTELLRDVRAVVQSTALQPFMRLWLEIASRASRDEPPYNAISGTIADGFETWISTRLRAANERESALLLATVDGLLVLDAIGRSNLADAAVGISRK